MKHTENEMLALKNSVNDMWRLVISQLEKGKHSFLHNDIETALEIVAREKRVDAFELKIDSDGENYIALYSPVAIDLRLVLSLIKISNTLERIGDFTVSVARHVIEEDCNKVSPLLIEDLQIERMLDILQSMLSEAFVCLETENTKFVGKILAKDEEVNHIYRSSLDILTKHMEAHPEDIRCGLQLLLLIRKLERIGDHCSNIIEEIVFYVDAKVLKHSGSDKSHILDDPQPEIDPNFNID